MDESTSAGRRGCVDEQQADVRMATTPRRALWPWHALLLSSATTLVSLSRRSRLAAFVDAYIPLLQHFTCTCDTITRLSSMSMLRCGRSRRASCHQMSSGFFFWVCFGSCLSNITKKQNSHRREPADCVRVSMKTLYEFLDFSHTDRSSFRRRARADGRAGADRRTER